MPNARVKEVAQMLKTMHAPESLVAARTKVDDIVAQMRHFAGTKRGTRRYLNMDPLFKQVLEPATA